MIARIWHGVVPESKSDDYLENQKEHGISDYLSTEGNRGVFVLRKNEEGKSHYLLLTLWDSVESIHNFAGEDIEKARYYPDDEDYLIELEPNVTHYEVVEFVRK
ncbi:antibiotic biosynthesis monooxygenase [candidate division KSB1 bacterium]|nr:antibiotic biosynthesis monooxygenase [candidate division KSB1 bacterium]NIR69250.1 antibiotic biosynthesis monooxygenase [candidate division KSB1 bacterium]NIS27424.1 antibiotic biosynthesis monooxygenase [candidate division KSB1 bacterium]NIT74249.1 antibiotic biosynthesis monooxygenase [candidate division KSB1 bacterium]NIU28141.1 antibiotic biosynthesis monooxygenase [candidate division KSB1 bacterium]